MFDHGDASNLCSSLMTQTMALLTIKRGVTVCYCVTVTVGYKATSM